MSSPIIRTIEDPKGFDVLPSQRERGIVQQIEFVVADDGYHVHLVQTLWTRNKRGRDQRGEIINQKHLMTFTAQEAAALTSSLAWTLIHVDSRGPKED